MNPVEALVIRPGNEVRDVVLRGLPDYKEALDGAWLEAVVLPNGVMYVDEEALLKNPGPSDVNTIATHLVQMIGRIDLDNPIYGPAIVVGLPDRQGYDTDIPSKLRLVIRLIETSLK